MFLFFFSDAFPGFSHGLSYSLHKQIKSCSLRFKLFWVIIFLNDNLIGLVASFLNWQTKGSAVASCVTSETTKRPTPEEAMTCFTVSLYVWDHKQIFPLNFARGSSLSYQSIKVGPRNVEAHLWTLIFSVKPLSFRSVSLLQTLYTPLP